MAIINKGKSFNNGEQLTANKLNQLIDNATFTTSAVDNLSTWLSGGAIIVRDGGVTTAKLNDSAVTTAKITDANVTTAKIADANVTTAKIADANVTFAKLTDVIDDDTMATASDTTLATSESIKAYVDSAPNFTPSSYAGGESVTLPNGLIMKMGIEPQSGATGTVTYGAAFPTSVVSVNITPVDTLSRSTSLAITASSSSAFSWISDSNHTAIHWQAIGY